MSKKKKKIEFEFMNKEQETKLKKMVTDMLEIAGNVIDEYKNIEGAEELELDEIKDLANLSGSLTQIHEDSPYLDEIFKGESWRRVMKNIPTTPNTEEDNDNK